MVKVDWNGKLEEMVSENINWSILGVELDMVEEDRKKGYFHWYYQLEEDTPYQKLKLFRQACYRTM